MPLSKQIIGGLYIFTLIVMVVWAGRSLSARLHTIWCLSFYLMFS